MIKIFLIAGLDADTRIYNKIELPGYNVIPIYWVDFSKTDTLAFYAQKLIFQYNIKPGSIVIGNSLGGIIAVEIAKKITLKKTILIAGIKTIDEEPWYFHVFRILPVYKVLPEKLFPSVGFLIRHVFGKMAKDDLWLFKDMLKNSSPGFMKWAMGAILNWENKIIPPNLYQINGDKDLIFPYRNIKNTILIKGGSHIMIFNKAKEINKILKNILKK